MKRHKKKQGPKHALSVLASFRLMFGLDAGKRLDEISPSGLQWVLRSRCAPEGDKWAVEQYLQAIEERDRRRGRGGRGA